MAQIKTGRSQMPLPLFDDPDANYDSDPSPIFHNKSNADIDGGGASSRGTISPRDAQSAPSSRDAKSAPSSRDAKSGGLSSRNAKDESPEELSSPSVHIPSKSNLARFLKECHENLGKCFTESELQDSLEAVESCNDLYEQYELESAKLAHLCAIRAERNRIFEQHEAVLAHPVFRNIFLPVHHSLLNAIHDTESNLHKLALSIQQSGNAAPLPTAL